eukprot:6198163-Pleurochrysis_carterae.AAC.1
MSKQDRLQLQLCNRDTNKENKYSTGDSVAAKEMSTASCLIVGLKDGELLKQVKGFRGSKLAPSCVSGRDSSKPGSSEGRLRTVVEEIARFEGAGGAVGPLGRVATREKSRGARLCRLRVGESFCGDGVCVSSRQTIETFAALLSVDERLGLIAARPNFQSPRSPSRS